MLALIITIVILALIGLIIYLINKKLHLFGDYGKFMLGLGLAIILAIVFFILMLVLAGALNSKSSDIFLFAIMFIGLAQLIYIIPIILLTRKNQQYDMMKGVITGAILVALLNGSCYLLLLPNMRIGG